MQQAACTPHRARCSVGDIRCPTHSRRASPQRRSGCEPLRLKQGRDMTQPIAAPTPGELREEALDPMRIMRDQLAPEPGEDAHASRSTRTTTCATPSTALRSGRPPPEPSRMHRPRQGLALAEDRQLAVERAVRLHRVIGNAPGRGDVRAGESAVCPRARCELCHAGHRATYASVGDVCSNQELRAGRLDHAPPRTSLRGAAADGRG